MRYGMRLGRRSWVTGGGGVLIAATLAGLLYVTMMVSAWVVATALGLLVGLVAYALQNTKSARRAQLAMPLKGSLDEAAPGVLDGRTKVWAVYAVGDQFHHGTHPRKGEELLRLYGAKGVRGGRQAEPLGAPHLAPSMRATRPHDSRVGPARLRVRNRIGHASRWLTLAESRRQRPELARSMEGRIGQPHMRKLVIDWPRRFPKDGARGRHCRVGPADPAR